MAQKDYSSDENMEKSIQEIMKDLPGYFDDSMSPPKDSHYEPITPVKLSGPISFSYQSIQSREPFVPLDLSLQSNIPISKYMEPIITDNSKVHTFKKSEDVSALQKPQGCPTSKETSITESISKQTVPDGPLTRVTDSTTSRQTFVPLDLTLQPKISISKYLGPIRTDNSKVYTFKKSDGVSTLQKAQGCPETKLETSLKRGSNSIMNIGEIKKTRLSTTSATKKQQWSSKISTEDSSVLHKLLTENPEKMIQFERRMTKKEKEGTKYETPCGLDEQVNKSKKDNGTQTEEETGEVLEIISNLELMTDSLELELRKIKLIMGNVKIKFSGLKK